MEDSRDEDKFVFDFDTADRERPLGWGDSFDVESLSASSPNTQNRAVHHRATIPRGERLSHLQQAGQRLEHLIPSEQDVLQDRDPDSHDPSPSPSPFLASIFSDSPARGEFKNDHDERPGDPYFIPRDHLELNSLFTGDENALHAANSTVEVSDSQQVESLTLQRFSASQGKECLTGLRNKSVHTESHGGDMQKLNSTPHQDHGFQTSSQLRMPEVGTIFQTEDYEQSGRRKGSLGTPKHLEGDGSSAKDTESSGSLEVRLGFSDEEAPINTTDSSWQRNSDGALRPFGRREAPTVPVPSNATRTRKTQSGVQYGPSTSTNQKSRSSHATLLPIVTSSEAHERTGTVAQTKSVRILTPPRLNTARVNGRSVSGRKATPMVKMVPRCDIRDRYSDAKEQETNSGLEKRREAEERKKNKFENLTLDIVKGFDFRYTPLPEIESELNKKEDGVQIETTISLEMGQEHVRSNTIQGIRCNPRSSKFFDTRSGHEVVVVPDEEMFGVLYRLVKNLILHRRESHIASFVSLILNKSIRENIAGDFCKKLILFIEKLSNPAMLPNLHNFLFEKVADVDITWIQREIELHFEDKLASLSPESMTSAFVKKVVYHLKISEFVKQRKKDLAARAKEYRRKRRFLWRNGVKFKLPSVPKYPTEVEKKKSEMRMATEQFAHEFAWYSREIFLHDDIQSHFFLARFMMNNIHNTKTEEKLKCIIGRIGDVERADFFVEMERYITALWTKLIKELRDFLTYADPAALLEAFCADFDPRCRKVLIDVSTEMNPLGKVSTAHAVLIARYGNRIGSFCAKAFGRANDELSFKKKVLLIRGSNIEALCEVYEKFQESIASRQNAPVTDVPTENHEGGSAA